MTSIIHFTPISGAKNESPPCYLLQIDDFCFLLDCGCDENIDISYVEKLQPFIPSIDAVLLSHADSNHLGAFPYLVGKCGLSCDVYATTPVYQMGQLFAYDLYQSKLNYEEFDLFTLDDIDMAFEKVIQVKYNQTTVLQGKGQGLTITPLPAGHMLGGTIWRIVKDGGEDIIYATDFNHKKERHLNGCVLDKISRPSLLITDCSNIDYVPDRRKKRDDLLLNNILETTRSGGNVLLAIDTAGRVLELAHMLEQVWRNEQGFQAYSLVLLNNFSYNVIEYAKSFVEWMSDKLMRSFEGQRNNPFAFRHLKLCHHLNELNRIPEPYVIMASQPDLQCGFSRELFFKFSSKPNNSIILTRRSSNNTLASILMNLADAESNVIEVEQKSRVPLTGKELDDYMEAVKQEELEKERQNKSMEQVTKNGDDYDSEESDDDEFDFNDIDESKNLHSRMMKKNNHEDNKFILLNTTNIKHDLMMTRMDGRLKGGGFFKNAKKSYPMFPCVERKLKWDEYGESINPEQFVMFDMSRVNLADEKDNVNETIAGNDINKEEDMEQSEKVKQPPTKCIKTDEKVEVECRIEFIDFEGRSDGESLKRIISMIKPRRLILIRGHEEKIEAFSSFCVSAEFVGSDKIYTPNEMELVDVTTERHIYPVKLRDALVSSLNFSQAKDGAQLAWVEAEISMTIPELSLSTQNINSENDSEDHNMAEDSFEEPIGQRSGRDTLIAALQHIPISNLPPHKTIFVNELKLSDFKQILMKNGIQAEFSGGVLLCNGHVEVKRTETGHIHLEGTVSDDYFKVRNLLYDQYAIL
ncbi:cleavage and polyadenylation specificity factor subunit 2 [Blomia tropicalis]|nr:cleavage and polyadenylation specificity factor subunit 2 [Blomia tropicalis]